MLFIYLFYFQIKAKRKEETLGINISSVTLLKMGSKEKDGRISPWETRFLNYLWNSKGRIDIRK